MKLFGNSFLYPLLLSAYLLVFFSLPTAGESEQKKYVVFIALWEKGVPQDVIDILESNKKLKLVVPWKPGFEFNEKIGDLVLKGQIEPAIAFQSEPVLRYVYETEISSFPRPVYFSWQEDVLDIVARNQEMLKSRFQSKLNGIYLDSGLFSEKMIKLFQGMGIYWANLETDLIESGVYEKAGFYVTIVSSVSFQNADQCIQRIRGSDKNIQVIVFKDKTEITKEFLGSFAGVSGDDVDLVTFQDIISSSINVRGAPPKVKLEDNKLVYIKPSVWWILNAARNEIENYKNSGTADVSVLNQAKEYMYGLYNFKFLSVLREATPVDVENQFHERIRKIYDLLGRPVPEMENQPLAVAGVSTNPVFSVSAGTCSFVVENSWSGSENRILKLSAELEPNGTVYSVHVSSSVPKSAILDVYIDMNNKSMAGVTALLDGVDAYMEPDDAWEFVVRIENNSAFLYRPGAMKPRLVAKLNIRKDGSVFVPREYLRGNVLNWGYQAVMTIPDVPGKYKIVDYISVDDDKRQTQLKSTSIHLEAVHVK